MVIAMAEGEVESITDIRIDDVPITNSKFIQSGSKQNLWYEVYTGTDNQTVSTLIKDGVSYDTREDVWVDPFQNNHDTDVGIPEIVYPWTDNHRLRGIAYIALKFKWDNNAYSGIPDVTATIKGRKVYDPRKDSTSAHYDSSLGTSSHRVDDASTWEYSDNNALCIMDYLRNDRFGKGLPNDAINFGEFAQAADDIEDFTVTPYTNGTAMQLFTMNAVVDTKNKIIDNINDMLISCRAFMPYTNGKYSLRIDKSKSSTLDVTADMIIDGIEILGSKKEDRFNLVKVNFYNKSKQFKEDTAIYPDEDSTEYQALLAEDNDEPLVEEVDIHSVNNYYSARDIARLILERSRKNTAIAFVGTSELMDLEIGDVFRITHPTPAWTNKSFQVQELSLNFDGTVGVSATEYDSNFYTYETSPIEVPYVGTRLPDPNDVSEVTNLSATAGTYIARDGKTIGYIDVSWDAPDDALISHYEVTHTHDSVTDTVNVSSTSFRIQPTKDEEDYDISVIAVNGMNNKSSSVSVSATTADIDTTAPAEPTLPDTDVLVGGNRQIALDWVNPTDDDFDVVQIQVSTTSTQPADTDILATVKTSYYIHEVNEHDATRYYWIRALDRTGNASDWVALGNATTATKLGSADLDSSVDDCIDQRIDAYGLGSAGDFDSQVAKFSKFGANPFTLDAVFDDFDHGNQDVTITITGSKTWSLYTTTDPRPNNEANNNFTLTLYRKKSADTTWTQVTQWTRDGASGIVGGDYVLGTTNTYHNGISVDLSYTDDSSNLDNNVDYDYKLEPSNIGSNYRFDVVLTVEVNEIGTNNLADNYVDSFTINDTTGLITLGRTNGLSDLTDSIAPYVSSQVSNLVDSAPSTLDTLNELASALGDDPNFATTVTNSIATKASKSGDTFTGDITAPNVYVGTPDNQGRFTVNGTETSYGFTTEHDYKVVVINEQGSLNQALVLGDTGTASGSTLLVYRYASAGSQPTTGAETWSQVLNLTGTGNLTITGGLTASGYNNSNWDTAYGWGNHASAGYLTTSTGVQQLSDASSLNYQTPSSRRVNPNASNPTNEHYAVMTYGNGGNVTGQLATHFVNGATYNRAYNSGWSAWSRMFDDDYHPNADKWTTARTLSLTGDVTGSVSWDGSANASITTTVANDSHSHSNYITSNANDTATGRYVFSQTSTTIGGSNLGNATILLAVLLLDGVLITMNCLVKVVRNTLAL